MTKVLTVQAEGMRVLRRQRAEEEVQRSKEEERRAEREEAVEIVAAVPEPEPEADDRDEVHEHLEPVRERERERRLAAAFGRQGRQGGPELARGRPGEHEDERERDEDVPERPLARPDAAAGERREGDQRPGEEPAGDARPRLGRPQRLAAERRADRERERRRGGDEEAAREEQVEPATLDGEADPGEDGDDRAGEHHQRVEHEPRLGNGVRGAEAGIRDEERERRAEEPDQEHLAPQPGLERASAVLFHRHPCRHERGSR